jgi:WD40 repeat protein
MEIAGPRLATHHFDQTIRLWDVETGRLIVSHEDEEGPWGEMRLDAPGRWLTYGSGVRPVARVWNAATGELHAAITTSRIEIDSADLTLCAPDGKRVVTFDTFGVARVWSLGAPAEDHVLDPTGEGEIAAARFSPDGESVVTVGMFDRLALVRDARDGSELARVPFTSFFFPAFWNPLTRAELSAGGERLLVATPAGRAQVVDLATGEQVMWVGNLNTFHGFPEELIRLSPDGESVLLAGTSHHTLRDWQLRVITRLGEKKFRNEVLEDVVPVACFSPDSRSVAVTRTDHAIDIRDRTLTGALVAPPRTERPGSGTRPPASCSRSSSTRSRSRRR